MSFKKQSDFIRKITEFILNLQVKKGGKKKIPEIEQKQVLDCSYLLEQARKEWLAALSFFNNVTEKELVDQAIYALNAAEKRYFFLLKEQRRKKGSLYKKN